MPRSFMFPPAPCAQTKTTSCSEVWDGSNTADVSPPPTLTRHSARSDLIDESLVMFAQLARHRWVGENSAAPQGKRAEARPARAGPRTSPREPSDAPLSPPG